MFSNRNIFCILTGFALLRWMALYFANKSVVVCCDFDESTDMPTFGEITDIVVTPSRKVYFL